MDLDGLKQVNDSLGHEAGDRLLSDLAECLTDCVRTDGTVARLGGDEFAVILVGAKQRKDVELVAQTIIDALAKPFRIERQLVQISVSVGITLYPQDASSHVALLGTADKAMYKAKKSSSDRMCFYDSLCQ
jgi:diguanylate cyclase (GGDEF)-like protein